MTVWRWPKRKPTTGRPATRAIICIPGDGNYRQMSQALAHCLNKRYHVVAVSGGRLGWDSARRMRDRGDADVVVTVPGGPPPSQTVEVAK